MVAISSAFLHNSCLCYFQSPFIHIISSSHFAEYDFATSATTIYFTLSKKYSNPSSKTEKMNHVIQRNHLTNNPFAYKPAYTLNQLKRGIFCLACNNMMKRKTKYKMQCVICLKQESIESAVLRLAVEWNVLFENWKITTSALFH